MPNNPFDASFALITSPEIEGGFSNDAYDPGGKTKYGIADHRDGKIDGMADLNGDGKGDKKIEDLELSDTKAIYRKDYWEACRCDNLPWPLSLYVFDAAVNQGVSAAKVMLQQALNVKQDGILGAATIGRAKACNLLEVPSMYMGIRAQRYMGTRNFDRFGKGWLKRIFMIARAGERIDA